MAILPVGIPLGPPRRQIVFSRCCARAVPAQTSPWNRLSEQQASRKSLGTDLEAHGAGNARTFRRTPHTDMKFDPARFHALPKQQAFKPTTSRNSFVFHNCSPSFTNMPSFA